MELTGKVAVVTGASSGIGAASTRALAHAGATVVGVARRGDRLASLAGEHDRVHSYVADVTDDTATATLAGWVESRFGACHVLVNNAGASIGRRFRGPDDVADVRRAIDLNFLGTVRCMAEFADLLSASAPSRVVNVASVAGKLAAASPAYAASKFATVGLTEAVRADWARRGVAVCQLNPGLAVTEGFPQSGFVESRLGRRVLADPEDIAEAVVDVARRGSAERTVPRWYRALVVARHVASPVYRAALRRAQG